MDTRQLADKIRQWGRELGFQQIGFTDIDLEQAEQRLHDWLDRGYHAGMDWMTHHGHKRSRPAELEPGTLSVISARMDYLPPDTAPWQRLEEGHKAYISRYALGRDYHKLMRKRLAQLAERIRAEAAEAGLARALVDSAPVMEKPLAEKAGLGWQGKHTVLINREAGSWFFLGEIYTDIPLPVDEPASEHCGSCSACMEICPTGAIVGPWELDAGRCISYLTIEHKGSIPEELRPLMGNRVFGCDDCQLICPWNRYADFTGEADFAPRHGLNDARLVDLFRWDEATFDERTRGSPIRRAGYEGWLRNLAVALGNAPWSEEIETALNERAEHPSELVREHVHWALAQQRARRPAEASG